MYRLKVKDILVGGLWDSRYSMHNIRVVGDDDQSCCKGFHIISYSFTKVWLKNAVEWRILRFESSLWSIHRKWGLTSIEVEWVSAGVSRAYRRACQMCTLVALGQIPLWLKRTNPQGSWKSHGESHGGLGKFELRNFIKKKENVDFCFWGWSLEPCWPSTFFFRDPTIVEGRR